MKSNKRRITIEDVAKAAGVSRQTVSRAINQKEEISPATYERVMKAVESLGYRPSWVARGLATQRTNSVGLVVPDIANPFFPEIARGVQDVARAQEYNVFLCNTDESPEQELQVLYSLAAQPVDGILLFGSRASDEDLAGFVAHYQPLVILNCVLDLQGVSSVLVDNFAGADLAVEHLVSRGHTAIGMLAGPVSSPSGAQRAQGFREAMIRRGLSIPPDWIVPCQPTLEGGYNTAGRMLETFSSLSAFFAYNDLVALGALNRCADMGRPVPDSCAVVGFDDIRLASMVRPSLTTIHVDKNELGRKAMQQLPGYVPGSGRFPAGNPYRCPAHRPGIVIIPRASGESHIGVNMDLDQITHMYDLSGQTVVLTGGAGIIGGEIACALTGCGANVAILDRNPELADRLFERISRCSGEAIAVYADVLKRDTLEQAAETINAKFGSPQILINAAGGNHPSATTSEERSFFDLDEDALRFVFDLNAIGTMLPCQVFGRAMVERGQGVILNVASMNAFRPLTRIPAYSAAKAAISNFTQWLAVHMAQEYTPRIRVNAIAPGFLLTDQNRYLLTDKETGGSHATWTEHHPTYPPGPFCFSG